MLADFLIRLGKLILANPQAFVALAEAIEGGASEDELVRDIRAAQIRATEAAVEAELGPRP